MKTTLKKTGIDLSGVFTQSALRCEIAWLVNNHKISDRDFLLLIDTVDNIDNITMTKGGAL